eukprot:gene2763-5807_t
MLPTVTPDPARADAAEVDGMRVSAVPSAMGVRGTGAMLSVEKLIPGTAWAF